MKVLKISEEKKYAYLSEFVEEHNLGDFFPEVFGCTLRDYEGSSFDAIETLLPYVYGDTNDSFVVLPADRSIVVGRIKTPKDVYGFTIIDVLNMVGDMNDNATDEAQISINEEEADKVLDIMEKDADAGLGVSYSDVVNAIRKYLRGRVYYQPELTTEEWESGKLASFQVYRKLENAERDYPKHDINIYNGDDIENYSFVD